MDVTDFCQQSRVVMVVGKGGVGKTTTAAALAIAAARAGRRTVVITVDPARRLASALGVNALTNEPQPLHGWEDEAAVAGGSLDALMLDSKTTFVQQQKKQRCIHMMVMLEQ